MYAKIYLAEVVSGLKVFFYVIVCEDYFKVNFQVFSLRQMRYVSRVPNLSKTFFYFTIYLF